MKNQVARLFQISKKKKRRIVGLMSGTSLDGLDIAVCNISGNGIKTEATLEFFKTIPYKKDLRNAIEAVFAKNNVSFPYLCKLNAYLGRLYGQMVKSTLAEIHLHPDEVDLIASHGQTVQHVPVPTDFYPFSATLQIGDGDHIAYETGIITVSDFRQKHVAAGGEGAPLALYAEKLWLSHPVETRLLLNLGGIANITYLPPDAFSLTPWTTDTGPANTLIDQFCQKYFFIPFDENGKIAGRGDIHKPLLNELLKHPFFHLPYPKSTGQEEFNLSWVENVMEANQWQTLSKFDIVATLTQLTIQTIQTTILEKISKTNKTTLYLSGGGSHNPIILAGLIKALPLLEVKNISYLGINPDAKEALLFAILANETIAGSPALTIDLPDLKTPAVHFGKISFPF